MKGLRRYEPIDAPSSTRTASVCTARPRPSRQRRAHTPTEKFTEPVALSSTRPAIESTGMESPSSNNSVPPDADSALVDALVEYLNENVLDLEKVTKLDMLDSLAAVGGRLVPDPEGSSSDEYFEELPPS
jgi:hypothetical protein